MTGYSLTTRERQLVKAFRRLEPAQQQILWNALIHPANGPPSARLVLVVDLSSDEVNFRCQDLALQGSAGGREQAKVRNRPRADIRALPLNRLGFIQRMAGLSGGNSG
jgi:hypothetical protein